VLPLRPSPSELIRVLRFDSAAGARKWCAMSRLRTLACAVMAISAALSRTAASDVVCSEQGAFRINTLTRGLTFPWSLAFLPDGSGLITERPGRLRLWAHGQLDPKAIDGVPAVTNLFDVAVDPEFAQTSAIYLAYSSAANGQRLEVLRGRLREHRIENSQIIFRGVPKLPQMTFSGGRLLFAPDRTLLITVADSDEPLSQAQDRRANLGTVVRIHRDGSIPRDNPLVGRPGIRHEVYTYGHRNIQGIALEPRTQDTWIAEHGPKGGDELNLLRKGTNYGWPEETYGVPHFQRAARPELIQPRGTPPLKTWTPALAPSGLVFYEGSRFPLWNGNLFIGSLAQKHLRRIEIVDRQVTHEEALLTELGERIRDVRVGPDEYVYVLTDSLNGAVIRLEPVAHSERTCQVNQRPPQ